MAKIASQASEQHREARRNQLIDAAAAIALESGGESVTVAAVAQRAGLSRTSVYDYFSSSTDLIADLIIEELISFADELNQSVVGISDPYLAIEKWITTSLSYVADGRHLLAKALNAIDLPRERSMQIGEAHRDLLAALYSPLQAIGVRDISYALNLLQATTDVATKRIENGDSAEAEIKMTINFCIAGIRALI
jgi:AcrR family transcriptional regulator